MSAIGDETVGETVLAAAFSVILYGHMECDGEEVAIHSEAWCGAANIVADTYPRLAQLMRRTQAGAYGNETGGRAAEERLEMDLEAFDDENGVTEFLGGEEDVT